jgi:hypothetical protein
MEPKDEERQSHLAEIEGCVLPITIWFFIFKGEQEKNKSIKQSTGTVSLNKY